MASSGVATSSVLKISTFAAICAMAVVLSAMWQPAAAEVTDPKCQGCVDGCQMVAKAACSGTACIEAKVNQACRDRQFQLCASPCYDVCNLKVPTN